MKKGFLLLAIASGLSLLASHGAYAGNRSGAVTITGGAAYDFFAAKRNINNTWVIPTVGLAYNFDERWAIEGTYGNFNTKQAGAALSVPVKGNLYTIDGLYRVGQYGMFEPYVSAGLGVYDINPNGSSASNQANLNAGLGTQIFFDNSIALRGEVRDLYTMSGGKNDVTLGLGVSFLFGGNNQKAVEPALFKDAGGKK